MTETASFIEDKTWINEFGSLIMMQEPDKNDFGRQIDFDFTKSYPYNE